MRVGTSIRDWRSLPAEDNTQPIERDQTRGSGRTGQTEVVTEGGAGVFAAEDAVVRDARGRDVTIGHPTRIVSIGGAVTEILYALGADDPGRA